jgi:Tfp pilus assembly protein PilP
VKNLQKVVFFLTLFVHSLCAAEPPLSTTATPYPDATVRDPFRPPHLKPKRIIDESRPELERYELSELRLTGVITGADGKLSASVETSTGRGFMLKEGATIGINRGKVIDISMDRIVVEESTVDELGNPASVKTEMPLRRNPNNTN